MLSCFIEYTYWSNRAEENLYDIYRFRRERLFQALQDANDDVVGKCKHDRYSMTVYLRHFYITFNVHSLSSNNDTAYSQLRLCTDADRVCVYAFLLEGDEQFDTALKKTVEYINDHIRQETLC